MGTKYINELHPNKSTLKSEIAMLKAEIREHVQLSKRYEKKLIRAKEDLQSIINFGISEKIENFIKETINELNK